jgi:hypothetical protein
VVSFGGRFLANPDLFPARSGGDVWGNEKLRLDYAAGPYELSGLSPIQRDALAGRYAPLIAPTVSSFGRASSSPAFRPPTAESQAATSVSVFRAASSAFLAFDLKGWRTRFDFDYLPSGVAIAGRGWMARLDGLPRPAAAFWTCFEEPGALTGVFENFFRVLVAYRLLAVGGVLLHSAAVLDRGRAFVFCGRSGAGKTTLCALAHAQGLEVLSDELNAVYHGNPEALVESVPFAGDFGQRCAPRAVHPLGGLYRLEQAAEDRRSPLGKSLAVATLAACAPFVNGDPHRSPQLLACLERLTRACPPETLCFRRDGSVWRILAS